MPNFIRATPLLPETTGRAALPLCAMSYRPMRF
jgi:hypothetical protein